MFDPHRFLLFFAAALLLAVTPGPGIFYVLARSLAGGRREGVLSSFGTFVGGFFHVLAAALGVSAILAASAVAFHTVKYAGAAYLVWLGISMIRTRSADVAGRLSSGNLHRSSQPQDGPILLILHSAIHRARTRPCFPAIRPSWRSFCGSQYRRRSCRGCPCRSSGTQTQEQRAFPARPACCFRGRYDHAWRLRCFR
jgi:hypothetical protein